MLSRNDVAIESPCGLDFSSMTRREASKRFCGSCATYVHDLSSMTEDEARALLAAKASENLCVRYLADDSGQIAFKPDVPSSALTRFARSLMAAAVMTAPVTLTACMGAMEPKRPVASPQAVQPGARILAERGATRLQLINHPGTLIDENAPPPAPDAPLAPHAFVSGSCGGDALGCAEARGLLEQAISTEDFIDRLRTAGFNVRSL